MKVLTLVLLLLSTCAFSNPTWELETPLPAHEDLSDGLLVATPASGFVHLKASGRPEESHKPKLDGEIVPLLLTLAGNDVVIAGVVKKGGSTRLYSTRLRLTKEVDVRYGNKGVAYGARVPNFDSSPPLIIPPSPTSADFTVLAIVDDCLTGFDPKGNALSCRKLPLAGAHVVHAASQVDGKVVVLSTSEKGSRARRFDRNGKPDASFDVPLEGKPSKVFVARNNDTLIVGVDGEDLIETRITDEGRPLKTRRLKVSASLEGVQFALDAKDVVNAYFSGVVVVMWLTPETMVVDLDTDPKARIAFLISYGNKPWLIRYGKGREMYAELLWLDKRIYPAHAERALGHKFSDAIARGDVESAKRIQKLGVNTDLSMIWLASSGNVAMLRILLEGGASATPDEGLTPLFHALEKGPVEAVTLLVKHGAKLRGQTPMPRLDTLAEYLKVTKASDFELALLKGDKAEIAKASSSDLNQVFEYGLTPLRYAYLRKDVALAQEMKTRGANVRLDDPKWTYTADLCEPLAWTLTQIPELVEGIRRMERRACPLPAAPTPEPPSEFAAACLFRASTEIPENPYKWNSYEEKQDLVEQDDFLTRSGLLFDGSGDLFPLEVSATAKDVSQLKSQPTLKRFAETICFKKSPKPTALHTDRVSKPLSVKAYDLSPSQLRCEPDSPEQTYALSALSEGTAWALSYLPVAKQTVEFPVVTATKAPAGVPTLAQWKKIVGEDVKGAEYFSIPPKQGRWIADVQVTRTSPTGFDMNEKHLGYFHFIVDSEDRKVSFLFHDFFHKCSFYTSPFKGFLDGNGDGLPDVRFGDQTLLILNADGWSSLRKAKRPCGC